MPQKVRNSGRSGHFDFSTGGRWTTVQIHGWDIWIPATKKYVRYSPRAVAIAEAMRLFWITNRGARFPWRDTLGNLRYFVRRVGKPNRNDYSVGREIIRELGPIYMTEEGLTFVYACTRGPNAVAGFIQQQDEAEQYEQDSHVMFQVMEGRLARGTVEPAAQEFAVPVHQRTMRTKTLR